MAVVTAEIVEGADMSRFSDDVAAAVNGVSTYPDKAEDPVVRVVQRVATVASVAVTGPEDPAVLLAYADAFAERLKADPAITQVEVGGFSGREISIDVPAVALQRFGLDHRRRRRRARPPVDRHARRHDARAGGRHRDPLPRRAAHARRARRYSGEWQRPAAARCCSATSPPSGRHSPIRSVASYFNGRRAAIVAVNKTETQDALTVMAALERQMAAAQAEAPGNIELAISQDSTSNIRDRLRIIAVNGVAGAGAGAARHVALLRTARVVLGGDGPAGLVPRRRSSPCSSSATPST